MQKKKAVSLVVLVITIIVMIILASTIIMSLSNTNVLDRAENAVDVTNETTLKEVVAMKWMEGYTKGLRGTELKEYVVDYAEENMSNTEDYLIVVKDTGAHILRKDEAWLYAKDSDGKYTMVKRGKETLEIGDYINNYTATGTDYAGKWQVLGAGEDGSLLIISEDTIGDNDNTTTEDNVEIGGIQGVENGITKLDNVCSVYGKGYGAQKARCIRINEINKLTGYNPNNIDDYDPDCERTGTVASDYGTKISYYWTGDPKYLEYVKGDAEPKEIYASTQVTSTEYPNGGAFYHYDGKKVSIILMNETASETNKQYLGELISTKYAYTLAKKNIEEGTKIYDVIVSNNRYWVAYLQTWYSIYYMTSVSTSGQITNNSILYVTGKPVLQKVPSVRPVVELRPDIELTGSSTEGWTIVQN